MSMLGLPCPRKPEGLGICVWFTAIFSYRVWALNRRPTLHEQE